MLAAACTLIALAAWQPQIDDETALESFRALRATQKAMLVARVRGRLARAAHPAIARIEALRIEGDGLGERQAAPVFDPARWAPIAPARRTVAPGDPRHAAVAKRFARTAFLPDLHAEITYDWARGEVVHRGWPLGYEEVFQNLLAGYPPGSDHAVARVLATLDDDPEMRKLAWWFGHAYADLEARVFDGVTLYDAWYSGKIVDVPDVDAVPFAHEILGKHSMRSPLSGRPRDLLYEAIQGASLTYRKYRTMREAAAAAFVRADPSMDEMYARLVPRFHYLYAAHGDDVAALGKLLRARDRDRLVAEIDERVSDEDDDAFEVREGRRKELAELATLVREAALAELAFFAR